MTLILVESLKRRSAAQQDVEVVERKGKGHPDYICDAVMEAISIALCKEYFNNFGNILHHNIDKGLLAAGKNPVSHVGKIYNVLAHHLAKQIYENTEGVEEAHVLLLSQIGMPIDNPKLANVQILISRGQIFKNVSAKVEETVAHAFDNINSFCRELVHGKYPIC